MRLTGLDDKVLQKQVSETTPGMAHFAGTGPVDTTCRMCRWWNPDPDSLRVGRLKRDKAGVLKNRRCRKYTSLKQGMIGRGVKPEQRSCRHFERALVVKDLRVTEDGLE